MSRVQQPAAVAGPPEGGRWGAAAGAGAGATLSAALPVFLLGAAAVQVRADLGFGEAAFGVLVAAFFAAASLFSGVAGFAAERTDARRSMMAATGLAAMCMLAIGVLARSWWVLLVCMIAAGSSAALAQPAANLAIARKVPLRRRALALAIKQAAPPAANLLGGVALVGLVPLIGWRPIFLVAAAGAATFLLWFARRTDLRVPPVAAASRSGLTSPRVPLALLTLAALLGSAANNAMAAFFVQGVSAAGQSPALAGTALTVGSLAGVSSRLVVGWAADRSGRAPLPVIGGMLVLGAVGLVPLAAQDASLPLLLGATVLAFGIGWGWPGLFNFAVVSAYPLAPAGASGVTQTGMFAGGSLGPAVFGVIVEQTSYRTAWAAAAASMLLAAGAVAGAAVLLRRDR